MMSLSSERVKMCRFEANFEFERSLRQRGEPGSLMSEREILEFEVWIETWILESMMLWVLPLKQDGNIHLKRIIFLIAILSLSLSLLDLGRGWLVDLEEVGMKENIGFWLVQND